MEGSKGPFPVDDPPSFLEVGPQEVDYFIIVFDRYFSRVEEPFILRRVVLLLF